MSIHGPDAYQGTESVESTDSADEPRVYTKNEYIAYRQVNYGELVAAVADSRDLDAADAKAYISGVGRESAVREVYSEMGCTR